METGQKYGEPNHEGDTTPHPVFINLENVVLFSPGFVSDHNFLRIPLLKCPSMTVSSQSQSGMIQEKGSHQREFDLKGHIVNAAALRALQAPFKDLYRSDAVAAQKTLIATGQLGVESLTCRLKSEGINLTAGLHPAAGGDTTVTCSAELLLQSLVACAGVTLAAVATAMEIPIQGGTITAEGDLDFRGTLGVSKEVPVGFTAIRMQFDIDSTASSEQIATLVRLTERYCVVFQTLKNPPQMTARAV